MMQSDAFQSKINQSGCRMARERGTFSYEKKNNVPDLKEQIRELKALEDSPFWNRSEADIAGMILLRQIPKEIKKYHGDESGV
jgi:hypothetical protein